MCMYVCFSESCSSSGLNPIKTDQIDGTSFATKETQHWLFNMTSKHCPESAPSLMSASCNACRHVFVSLAPTLKNTGMTLKGADPGSVQKGISVFVAYFRPHFPSPCGFFFFHFNTAAARSNTI